MLIDTYVMFNPVQSTYCAWLLANEQNRRSDIRAVHEGDVLSGELEARPGQITDSINSSAGKSQTYATSRYYKTIWYLCLEQ